MHVKIERTSITFYNKNFIILCNSMLYVFNVFNDDICSILVNINTSEYHV